MIASLIYKNGSIETADIVLYNLFIGKGVKMYKLLIVDDESTIRNGLSHFFPWSELGYEVVGEAKNGLQALNFIHKNQVDVVLCDIKMPVMTGIDLAKELYEQKTKINIVFLSAYKDFEYAQKALVYGVKNYVIKPTKYDDLAAVFCRLKNSLDEERIKEINSESDIVYTNEKDNVLNVLMSYVNDNFDNATLEEASRLVHVNMYYLSKLFKQKCGQNFSEYVISVKMEKAAELLRTSDIKTYELSDITGYSTPKNFTRAFKKYFGKSPREYKNNLENRS